MSDIFKILAAQDMQKWDLCSVNEDIIKQQILKNQEIVKRLELKLKERYQIMRNRENGSWIEIDEEVVEVLKEILK